MGPIKHLPHRKLGGNHLPMDAAAVGQSNQGAYGWSSTNWSGYAVSSSTNGTYRSISATWVVPSVHASTQPSQPSTWSDWFFQWLYGTGSSTTSSDSYSATWIGIDGFTNSNLIQAGTSQNMINGQAQYYAWWEILPAAETAISTQKYPVSAGDTITTTIAKESNGTWTITMTNKTKNWKFQKTGIQYSGPQTSAEWIEEAPQVNGSIATLANYGQVTFSNCQTNGTGAGLQMSNAGVMTQNGSQVSTPSAPSTNGNSFTVAYGSSTPNAPA